MPGTSWTFLSNHGHVLVALADDPQSRVRDIAEKVGITERAVRGILADLQHFGYIEVDKAGRRNQYRVNTELALRHPSEASHCVGELLAIFAKPR